MGLLLELWKRLPESRRLKHFLLKRVNDQILIGVTGVIFNAKNEVLLLKHTYRKIPWSLPGGYLHANELPKIGLAREIEEETGFTVSIIRIVTIRTNSIGNLDLCYFGVIRDGKFHPSDEVTVYQFAHPKRLPPLIQDQYVQIEEALKRKKASDKERRQQAIQNKLKAFFGLHW